MLIGADILGVGATRPDGKGRHVTAARDLVPLPSGGVLIDTPGLRGVGLLDLEGDSSRRFPRSKHCRPAAGSATARMWPSRDVPSWPPSTREHCRPAAWRAGTSCGARRTTWRCARMPGCVLPSFAGGRPSRGPSGVRASADHEETLREENRQEEYGPQQRTSPAREVRVEVHVVFLDRTDAGRRLAEMVRSHPLPDPVVLALPRGGVPVGIGGARPACGLRRVRGPQGRGAGTIGAGRGRNRRGARALPADVPAEPTVWLDHELLRRLGLVAQTSPRSSPPRRRNCGGGSGSIAARGRRNPSPGGP